MEMLRIGHLCFSRGRLTRDACEVLPSLSEVESVILRDVHGADIAAKYITKMPSLTGLELVGQAIHDDVFSEFENLTQLETLVIDRSQVTDLTPLARMPNLEELWLLDTQTPVQEIQRLRKALPNCRIDSD